MADLYDLYLHTEIPQSDKKQPILSNLIMMQYWNNYRLPPSNDFDLTEVNSDREFVPYSNILPNKIMMIYLNNYRLKPNNDFYL